MHGVPSGRRRSRTTGQVRRPLRRQHVARETMCLTWASFLHRPDTRGPLLIADQQLDGPNCPATFKKLTTAKSLAASIKILIIMEAPSPTYYYYYEKA
jgi:hypothetical protein